MGINLMTTILSKSIINLIAASETYDGLTGKADPQQDLGPYF